MLGGYLGAGKTTLLNRLLSDNHGVRIALLINDFGAINIDADLIEKQTEQQINLTNGCVCCGLSDGFDEAIENLARARTPPDHILIEASGVADVHSLAQYGKAPGLALDSIIVVADATSVRKKANDKYVARTIVRQLQAADLLLLNKVDLIEQADLQSLSQWLGELTQGTPVVPTQFCDLPYSLLLGSGQGSSTKPAEWTKQEETHHHELYATWNFRSETRLSRLDTERMLAEFPPDLLRGKGFILSTDGLLEWHKVGRHERLTKASVMSRAPSATTLVAIALRDDLPAIELTRVAQRYLGPDLG